MVEEIENRILSLSSHMYGIYIEYVTCWAYYGYDSLKPYLWDHCEYYKLCSTLYRIIQMYAVQLYAWCVINHNITTNFVHTSVFRNASLFRTRLTESVTSVMEGNCALYVLMTTGKKSYMEVNWWIRTCLPPHNRRCWYQSRSWFYLSTILLNKLIRPNEQMHRKSTLKTVVQAYI